MRAPLMPRMVRKLRVLSARAIDSGLFTASLPVLSVWPNDAYFGVRVVAQAFGKALQDGGEGCL